MTDHTLITGTAGNDVLNGTADMPANGTGVPGDDTIDGLAGDDRIDGRGGADTIDAGPGDDMVLVTTFGPVVRTENSVYDGGDGDDTLDLSAATQGLTIFASRDSTISIASNISISATNFETLILGSGADDVKGIGFYGQPALRDIFLGGGDDQYSGGGGTPSMTDRAIFVDVHGGGGNDRIASFGVSIFGDEGNDILSAAPDPYGQGNVTGAAMIAAGYHASETTGTRVPFNDDLPVIDGGTGIDMFVAPFGAAVDLAAGTLTYANGTVAAHLVSIETVLAAAGGGAIIGNDGDNILLSDTVTSRGASSSVSFRGGGGNDTLDVGTSGGIADGGAGDDAIHVARSTAPVFLTVTGGAGDDSVHFAYAIGEVAVTTPAGAAYTELTYRPSADTIAVYHLSGIETYVFADRTIDLDDGNPLVDDLDYLIRYPDVAASGLDADDHYARYGWHEGRDPSAYFSTNGYLAVNGDVRAAALNPLAHYDQYGWKEGRDPSAAFDTTLYLLHNADVKAAGIDPLAHFLRYGQAEGRAAYAAIGPHIAADGFDAEYYLLANADVAAAAVNATDQDAFAFRHYQTYGWHEGRDPNAWFDDAGYLAAYRDVAAAGLNPLDHYAQYGWHEGRDPSAAFDTTAYLAANADVARAGVNPLLHYLQSGAYELRSTFADGAFDI